MARKTPAEKAAALTADIFKPSKCLSVETKQAKAEAYEERQSRSVAQTFIPSVNAGWKEQKDVWANASEDDRKGMLYDMVLKRGFIMGRKNTIQRIARYFNVKQEEINKDEYLPILWMADEARVAMIDENVLNGFLTSDKHDGGKYHLQNTYAYKVQHPAWEGVDVVNTQPTAIIYNEIKGENTELRTELEQLVLKRNAELDRKKLN